MNQSPKQTAYTFILLLLIGTGAFAFAFWLIDHRQAMSNSDISMAVLIGIFFVSYTLAFLLLLRWRDKRRAINTRAKPSRPDLTGTVYGLLPEHQYRVMKSFTDFYGNSFEKNELLRFKERHFLPYDGGHTIVFDERSLYLQEDDNREILENFSEYVAQIEQ